MKTKKQALFHSIVSLILCISMFVGTTFAWFTDTVTSGNNIIASGTLDVELYHSNATVTDERVDSATQLFMDLNGRPILWEPGVVSYENLRITNEGNLALAYQMSMNTANENYILDPSGEQYGLSQILKVGVVEGGITATDRASVIESVEDGNWTTLADFVRNGSLLPEGEGESEKTWGVVIYWEPGDNDNRWNLNNGKQLSEGEFLMIELGIKLVATQEVYESDSFGNDYDTEAKQAVFPEFAGGTATKPVTPNDQGLTDADVTMQAGQISATVPAGVKLADGTTELKLTVSQMGESGANVTLGEDEQMRSLDVHIEGVAADNTTPITVTLKKAAPTGLNMGNYKIYHVEATGTTEMTLVASDADFTAHNQFKYDPATGDLVLYMATFSEVAMVAEPAKWEGNFDYNWYDASKTELTIANADQLAAFGAIVGGMKKVTGKNEKGYNYSEETIQDSFSDQTVKLVADIDLGDDEENNVEGLIFYPIGYYNSEGTYERTNTAITSGLRNFEGTFDGQGHTIANFYHNTWEMKGDHDWYSPEEQYYRDGMGLFGRLYKATVKNLTVRNFKSDGEIATTGVIAAYADGATFENISIFDCNPRVYNIGNGGIVGCVGWYAKEAGLKTTFKNITVDNSNKISALWGSYDVACGGLVGQYYPTSGQSSVNYPVNAGIHMENCHVAAQMDVYNDVCGNYQYYAYRYAGMLIGSIRENTTNEDGKTIPNMTGISATGCTVNYGDWNDYYYCEFEKNGHPSYSGPDDYKFSRVPHSELNFTDSNGNGVVDANERASVTGCKHVHTDAEDNRAIYLPFYQLFTGYSWGVSSIGLKEYSGIVTDLGITEGDQQESVVKFAGNKNITTLKTDKEYTLGTLFSVVDNGVAIVDASVSVGVTDLNAEDGIVTAVFNDEPEKWQEKTITFNGTGAVNVIIQDYQFCKPTILQVMIAEEESIATVEKFDIVMNNGDFLHRVGNSGTVALDKLFKAKEGVTVGTVSVTVEDVNGTGASGTYSDNAIRFNGTGVVKVTIEDDDTYCTPTELYLEVVDAINVTTATSATKNNVVLLNNCAFSSLEVSDGYALYGNGFTMTCSSDSAALDMGYSFVTLDNGTLDNVQIVCPNFDYAVLYKSNMTESGNRSETTDRTRYYNVKSGVMASGNSQILNSRISGGRAAVNVSGGNCVIDNSRIELGAVASILVGAANSLTLRDVTLVQKPTASTHDSSKTLMGFSVLAICDSVGNSAPITLEGTLIQNAWVDSDDTQYVPSAGQSIVNSVLKKSDYLHDIDGDGVKESLNLGIAYMPEAIGSPVKATSITDNRTNKTAVPYEYTTVNITSSASTYVYSYTNAQGTDDSVKNEAGYNPDSYGDIISLTYSDMSEGLTMERVYGSDGWIYELNVDLDKASGYALDFSKLSMVVNNVTVTDFKVNGGSKPASTAVTAGGTTYTLSATVNGKEYTATFKVTGTETTKESPSLVAENYGSALLVGEAGSTFTKDTWHGAAPALEGIQIKYWSVAEKQYKTIKLSDYTPTTAGRQNGSNTTWTYSPANGDFTLTITGGQVHSSNKVDAIPVVCGGKLYFVAATSNGLVNYGNSARTIPVSYSFKDNNGGTELKFSHTWSIECPDKATAYDYSDFMNGTSKTFTIKSSNGGCVTGDTLVTLADGTQKRIDQVSYADQLLVWNFYTGEYAVAPSALIQNHGYAWNNIIKLTFNDGTMTKAVNEHGYFDATINEFVIIMPDNVADYVGHEFVREDGNSYTTVTLVSAEVSEEYVEAYSILAANYYNFITDRMFSLTSPVIETNFFMPFMVGENMTFDAEKMAEDIEMYGLYEYADFEGKIPYEVFECLNIKYLKVAVGKGLVTYDQIIELLDSEGVI